MNDVMLQCGDCLEILQTYSDKFFDLTFTSPPYEDARTYGIDFAYKGNEWVDWALPRFLECLRVTKGLVAWVVEGRTRNFTWSATPVLLMARLLERGVQLRKPPIFYRFGVWGSGGSEWLRNDYEHIICATHGRLSWADNRAMGQPPKYKAGGKPTNRLQNGARNTTPSKTWGNYVAGDPAIKCNPGNVIKCNVGGGKMGSTLAHENEAPFPEVLAEFFIRSFCPPDGTVLDPFVGSGTTCAVAQRFGRNSVGIDIRQSQIELSQRRIAE